MLASSKLQQISFRCDEDIIAYVDNTSSHRGVDKAVIWRELVSQGYQSHQEILLLKQVLRINVKILTLTSRFVALENPQIIEQATKDAKELIDQFEGN